MIYVLTEGEYSDYRIVGVFSTEEKAETEKVNYPQSEVEEYELDPFVIGYGDFNLYSASKQLAGEHSQVHRIVNSPKPDTSLHFYEGLYQQLSRVVVAKDQKHAEKIWQDDVRNFMAGQTTAVEPQSGQIQIAGAKSKYAYWENIWMCVDTKPTRIVNGKP